MQVGSSIPAWVLRKASICIDGRSYVTHTCGLVTFRQHHAQLLYDQLTSSPFQGSVCRSRGHATALLKHPEVWDETAGQAEGVLRLGILSDGWRRDKTKWSQEYLLYSAL